MNPRKPTPTDDAISREARAHIWVCPRCGSVALEPDTWCDGETPSRYVIHRHPESVERKRAVLTVTQEADDA